jgi:hypothetical protein
MDYIKQHKLRIIIALIVMLWLKFLLIPTAMAFYELHHATGIDGIYWGYSVFKAAGYYFGVWEYQTLVCVVTGLLIALPWWQAIKRLFTRGDKV